MKRFLTSLLCTLLFSLLATAGHAQFYTAGNTDISPLNTKSHPWEISLAGSVDFMKLKDVSGWEALSHQKGLSARALFYAIDFLALGLEGTAFADEKIAGVEKYTVYRMGLVSKLILATDTLPRSYVLLGGGKTARKLNYTFDWKESSSSAYYLLGAGVETDIWEMVFAGLEIHFIYNDKTPVGSFYHLRSRWETQLLLRAGIRF